VQRDKETERNREETSLNGRGRDGLATVELGLSSVLSVGGVDKVVLILGGNILERSAHGLREGKKIWEGKSA
jgi:hypothetical protein